MNWEMKNWIDQNIGARLQKNDRLWNVPLYDVIVWLNTSSAEDDQRLLLHHCLFSPAHRFMHVV